MLQTIALRTIFFMLVSLAFFSVKPIHAQDRAGTLRGVVKDAKDAPVAGAFVKMHNAERRLTFMVISQEQGHYAVNTLPRGKYTVQAIGGDFQSERSAPADVVPGAAASVNLALTVTRAAQLAPAWPGRLPGQQGG